MQTLRILLALFLLTGTAMAGPYDGIYRPDMDSSRGWDCKTVGMDGGAVAISGDQFFGVENRCTLTNPTSVRDMDATLYDAICSAEGDEYKYRVMLMKTETGVAIIYSGGGVVAWRRCE